MQHFESRVLKSYRYDLLRFAQQLALKNNKNTHILVSLLIDMIGLLKALTVLAVYWYFDVIQQNLTEVKLDWSTE